jgi:amino acid transporter
VLFGMSYIAPLGMLAIYGELDQISKGTPSGAYLLATVAMLFTALSYGRMVTLYPVAGSAYTYVRRTIGNHLGFLIGWMAMLDYILLPAVAWLLGGVFASSVTPGIPMAAWILIFVLATTAVNVGGIMLAERMNYVLMAVQLAVLILFTFMAAHHVWATSGSAALVSSDPFFRSEIPISATVAGAAFAALSFLGFDAITTLSEETVNARKIMRRAILTVALVCGTLFIVVSYVTELAHPGTGFRDPQSAVDEIAHAVGGNFLKVLFIAGILTTQAAGGVAMQTTVARLLYAMGRDGVLPRPFAYLHPRFKTPVFNLALTGLIGLVGLIVTVETATTFINFGAFVAFTFVNLSVIAHAWKTRRQRRMAGMALWLLPAAIGVAATVWLLLNLGIYAHILGGIWCGIGIVYLAVLTRGFKRPPPQLATKEERPSIGEDSLI